MTGAGAMREQLVIETAEGQALRVAQITRSGTTATVETAAAHGYATGDYVTLAGAVQTAYNGRFKVTVTGTQTFTIVVAGSPASPATGAITSTYTSDAQGGRRDTWRTVATVRAALVPIRAGERLQLAAIQSDVLYRFRVRLRDDLTTGQRARWTPAWPPAAAEQLLEIQGVLPIDDGRAWLWLDCARSPR